jgi:octaheme c-type cytochrome (tetrathionate reductase family)
MMNAPRLSLRRFPPLGFLAATCTCSLLLLPATAQIEDHLDEFENASSYQDASSCIACHEDAGTEVMATSHWTWNHTDTISGQTLGKKNVINNFCVATMSNEARCTSCHIGTGWTDNRVELTDESKIDCLVCHDTTGTYKKPPTAAGAPDPSLDLSYIARNVGLPSRRNCGTCHFYGGGGDAVKHGSLDSTMENPLRSVDVHMGTDGGNFSCTRCHADSDNTHEILGTRYPTDTPDHMLCESCHTDAPHDGPDTSLNNRLNGHTDRVACQTCHIPGFARGGRATKMTWDWTTAGNRMPDGSDRVIKDANGDPTYHSKKGTFTWKENVIPELRWFNGDVTFATLDTPIVPGETLTFNALGGSEADPDARIFPFKRFTGKQPYDAGTGKLAIPHLFPKGPTDTDAYWKGYDWENALSAGQSYVGRTWVGPVGYVSTEMFWVQNHMVAPKEDALHCSDCHAPNSRLNFAKLGYSEGSANFLQNFYADGIATIEVVDPGAQVDLKWTSWVGFDYQVKSSTDLVIWHDEPGGAFSAGATEEVFTFSDTFGGGGAPAKKYYRVIRWRQ